MLSDELIRAGVEDDQIRIVPDEQEAIQSQMLDLMRFGYNKTQIVNYIISTIKMHEWITHSDMLFFQTKLEETYDDLKEERASEYVYES